MPVSTDPDRDYSRPLDWDRMDNDQIRAVLCRRFQRAEAWGKPFRDLWDELYRVYRFKPKPREKGDDRPNLFVPRPFSEVHTVVPRLHEALFASRPYLGMLPREASDSDHAQAMETLVDYQLEDRIDIQLVYAHHLMDVAIFGTGVLEIGWRTTRHRQIVGREPIYHQGDEPPQPFLDNGLPNPAYLEAVGRQIFNLPVAQREVEADVIEYDDPWIEPRDLYDFYPEPRARDIDHARWVFLKERTTLAEVRRRVDEELYDQEGLKELQELQASHGDDDHTGAERRMEVLGHAASGPDEDEIQVILWHYWEDDRVITLANEKVVLRNRPNPFWLKRKPFIVSRLVVIPHEFYGMGVIEPIVDLSTELNTIRNQRIYKAWMDLQKPLVANANVEIQGGANELRFRPDHVIWVRGVPDGHSIKDVITTLDVGNTPPAGVQEEAILQADIERTLGTFNPVRGEVSGSDTTATEVVRTIDQANFRFKLMIMLLEKLGLRRIGMFLVALNQQFITSERLVRIVGDTGVRFEQLSPADIQGQFDVVPAGSSVEPLANKQVQQRRWLELFNQLKGDEEIDQLELRKRLLQAFEVEDVEKFLVRLQQPDSTVPMPAGGMDPMAMAAALGGQAVTPTLASREALLGTEQPFGPDLQAPLTAVGGQVPQPGQEG